MPKAIRKIYQSGLPWVLFAIVILMTDRWSKDWVLHHLDYFDPWMINSFLNFTLTFNKGAAFSFLSAASGWQNIFLGTIACGVCLVVLISLYRVKFNAYLLNSALALILGGALGNAWDRVLYGHVVDFLSFHWHGWYFAIFNIADSAICVGALLMFIHCVRGPK